MTATKNWGRENRIRISLKFYYSFDLSEGVGLLVNISYTGALIVDSSVRPEIGTRIVVCLHAKSPRGNEEVTPFELAGVVVRHNAEGFAIKFEDNQDPGVRQMVEDIIESAKPIH